MVMLLVTMAAAIVCNGEGSSHEDNNGSCDMVMRMMMVIMVVVVVVLVVMIVVLVIKVVINMSCYSSCLITLFN